MRRRDRIYNKVNSSGMVIPVGNGLAVFFSTRYLSAFLTLSKRLQFLMSRLFNLLFFVSITKLIIVVMWLVITDRTLFDTWLPKNVNV